MFMCVCVREWVRVCVCVCEREREKERKGDFKLFIGTFVGKKSPKLNETKINYCFEFLNGHGELKSLLL